MIKDCGAHWVPQISNSVNIDKNYKCRSLTIQATSSTTILLWDEDMAVMDGQPCKQTSHQFAVPAKFPRGQPYQALPLFPRIANH